MNEYKITYTTDPAITGGTETFTMSVTDRTEAAAKKFFNSTAKECGRKFQSIELLRTDASATKRNERDTLEIIRQMVADLGPDSYLATAFEGCFEDAESNIENDFGDSMSRRWKYSESQLESAKEEVKALKEQLEESKKDWEAAHAAAHEISDQKDAEIATLQAQVLSPDDMEDIRQLLSDRATEADEKAKEAAAEIVEHADDPAGKEFQDAVKMHRNYTREAEYTRNLLERVVAAQAAARVQD